MPCRAVEYWGNVAGPSYLVTFRVIKYDTNLCRNMSNILEEKLVVQEFNVPLSGNRESAVKLSQQSAG